MLEVSDIYKHYKENKVLRGASFTARPGDCVGIIGANGCGKTTLFSILAGTIKGDEGSLKLDGKEAFNSPRRLAKYIAYVPQENPIIEDLSVKDNLKLWYKGDKNQLKQDLEQEAPHMMGIGSVLSKTAGKLSGGMKKRLSIACALSNQASILVMDEPGAALDLMCKEDIRKYLTGFMKQGGIVLLASHELAELSLCNKMYVLKQGKLMPVSTNLSAQELVSQFI